MSLSVMLQQLASGMVVSVEIFVVTLLFSLPLGLLICFGRMSKNPAIRGIVSAYISVMRGTPLMLQLMVVYFGPYFIFGIRISMGYSLIAVFIAFSINYAAYFAEIYRGGIDEVCKEAARQEIIRRYYKSMEALVRGTGREEEVYKIELLLKQAHVTIEERKVVPAALKREEETGAPAAAMELPDGRIVTGKTSELLGASSALLLNALKELAGIEHDKHVISPEALKPIQALKTEYLGSKNPRLHSDETLIALSISAADNEDAKLALQQIPKLKGCQVHTSVLLSQVDILEFRKLGVELTCEPKSEHAKKLQK